MDKYWFKVDETFVDDSSVTTPTIYEVDVVSCIPSWSGNSESIVDYSLSLPQVILAIEDADVSDCAKQILENDGSPTYYSAKMRDGSSLDPRMF